MLRHRVGRFVCLASIAAAGCGGGRAAVTASPAARVKALADAYLAAYFERFPEQITQYGVPGHRQDGLTDNSLAADRAWEAREDAFLADLKPIDPAAIDAPPLRATYAIARQALEGSVARRVCRDELWSVSEMTGWQISYGYLVTIQPVGTDAARADALARWRKLPGVIDTEIVNLRKGLKRGFSAPKQNVRTVIEQVRTLATSPLQDSPFASPAQRDKTEAFVRAFEELVTGAINPAAARYADFLEKEYLPAAREAIPVTANPDGARCYDASVLAHSSSPKTAKEVHLLGLRQIERLTAAMRA